MYDGRGAGEERRGEERRSGRVVVEGWKKQTESVADSTGERETFRHSGAPVRELVEVTGTGDAFYQTLYDMYRVLVWIGMSKTVLLLAFFRERGCSAP
jgi:hypothetical protein